jgi:hypothetical protein
MYMTTLCTEHFRFNVLTISRRFVERCHSANLPPDDLSIDFGIRRKLEGFPAHATLRLGGGLRLDEGLGVVNPLSLFKISHLDLQL